MTNKILCGDNYDNNPNCYIVGRTKGTNKEYFIDKNFIRNITEANKYNIDTGIYC